MTEVVNETRVEAIEREVEQLEQQLRQAEASGREAQEQLIHIGQEQDGLAHLVFSGDLDSEMHFRELEEEERLTERSLRVTEGAKLQIRERLREAEERLMQARIDAHKADYARKSKEVEELSARREEAAEALVEALGDERSALIDLSRIARSYDQDLANNIFTSTPWRKYLKSKLGSWLR